MALNTFELLFLQRGYCEVRARYYLFYQRVREKVEYEVGE